MQAAEHLPGTAQSHWLSLLRRELDNLRCALREWIDRADFDHAAHMATALTNFWVSCGLLSEGQTWFNSVLALRTPASLTKADEQTILRYARVLGDASVPALLRGALSETRDYLNAALSLVNRLGNTERAVRIIAGLGVIDMIEGRYADAVTKIEHALGHLREEGPSAQSGMALYNLGVIAGWQGDAPRMTMRLTEAYEMNAQIGNQSGAAQALALHAYFLIPGGALTQAQTLCDQSLQLSHSVDDEACVAIGTGVLARMALTQGRMADAAEHFASALRTLSEQGRQEFCLYCLEGLAQIAAMTQQPQRAARLFGSVEGIRKRTGIAEPLSERERNLSAIALAQNVMGQTAYAMAVADGRAMNFAQAVAARIRRRRSGSRPCVRLSIHCGDGRHRWGQQSTLPGVRSAMAFAPTKPRVGSFASSGSKLPNAVRSRIFTSIIGFCRNRPNG